MWSFPPLSTYLSLSLLHHPQLLLFRLLLFQALHLLTHSAAQFPPVLPSHLGTVTMEIKLGSTEKSTKCPRSLLEIDLTLSALQCPLPGYPLNESVGNEWDAPNHFPSSSYIQPHARKVFPLLSQNPPDALFSTHHEYYFHPNHFSEILFDTCAILFAVGTKQKTQ